jgi:hypothetical protein
MKKIFTIIATVAVLSLSSCKDYLDINHSPNAPEEDLATMDMALPAAEMALAARYGDVFRILGGYFSEHYAHYFGTSNYVTYSQFKLASTSTNGAYMDLNRAAIGNATFVKNKAKEQEIWGTYLAATVIRAFSYQVLVDAYGETPYSEAQQGLENLNPKFDEGKDIYAGIIAELDEALAKVTAEDMPVATNMLYPDEGAGPWIRFANALKLKILMRERAVVNVDDQLKALVEEGKFPTEDVAWNCFTSNASGKANPFYQEEFASYFGSTQVNVALNVALYRAMSDYGDSRLQAFFSPNNSKQYWGSISGDNLSTSTNYKAAAFCRPNMHYNDPVYLISLAEINFLLSEYYAKVGKDAAMAKEYYEAAIAASFETAGAEGVEDVLEAYPYDGTDKTFGIQKWIALSGINNFEAWCEMRRLGFPTFGGKKAEDIYSFAADSLDPSVLEPGDLYTPYQVNSEVGPNQIVQRFPYAESSKLYNSNYPGEKSLTTKVFWAK